MTVATDRLPGWTLAVLAAVHHAEVVAVRVGDPFGAVILALAVTVIELGLIVSILLGDQPEPTLVRDTIQAVVVLVLLALSFMMALITYGTGRASLLSGVVHLMLLATWLFLIIAP